MNDVEKQMREMAVGDVMQIERAGKIVCVPGGWVVDGAFVPKAKRSGSRTNTMSLADQVAEIVTRNGDDGVLESQIGKWCLSYREAPTKEQRRAVRDLIESGAVARIKPPGNGRGVRLVASC